MARVLLTVGEHDDEVVGRRAATGFGSIEKQRCRVEERRAPAGNELVRTQRDDGREIDGVEKHLVRSLGVELHERESSGTAHRALLGEERVAALDDCTSDRLHRP